MIQGALRPSKSSSPDGTNLESVVLGALGSFIEHYTIALCLPGIESFVWVQLQRTLKLVLVFQEAENAKIPKERLPRPEFDILYRIYSAVSVALALFTTLKPIERLKQSQSNSARQGCIPHCSKGQSAIAQSNLNYSKSEEI